MSEHELQARRERLEKLRASGVDPFPARTGAHVRVRADGWKEKEPPEGGSERSEEGALSRRVSGLVGLGLGGCGLGLRAR